MKIGIPSYFHPWAVFQFRDMLWICHQWRLGFNEHRDTPRTHKTWRFSLFNRPHHVDSLSDLLFHVQKACSYNRLRWAIFMYLKKIIVSHQILLQLILGNVLDLPTLGDHTSDLRFKKFHSNCHVKSESLTLR